MRLVAFIHKDTNEAGWGIWQEDGVLQLKDLYNTYPDLLSLIKDGEKGLATIEAAHATLLQHSEVEVVAPFIPHKNIMCVGKNYREHALEMSAGDTSAIPKDPLFFTKSPRSVIGPNKTINAHSDYTSALDYEGELLVIIGKEGVNIPEEQALDYVFGYSILNDITARDLQKKHQQFFKGKSLDTFAPFGPVIVTKDEISDPQNLTIETYVNEERRQNGHTSQMIFSVANLIHVLSQGMTLQPGDLIATGTPSGVGQGFQPPRYLKSGDTVRIVVEGIGELTNQVQ